MMGAYTWASASEFNFFPKATVLALDRGRLLEDAKRMITRRRMLAGAAALSGAAALWPQALHRRAPMRARGELR